MSTTIYNGKILPNMDLYQTNQYYKKLRSEMIPRAKDEYVKLIARTAQEIYVYIQTGVYPGYYEVDLNEINAKADEFREDSFKLIEYAFEFANKIVRKTSAAIFTSDSENDADFDVSLTIFPLHDKILALPYANNDVLHDVFFKREEFVDYGYWNNTDPPEELSEEEWEQRKKDWDEALPGIGIPMNNGIVLRIVDAIHDVIDPHVYYVKDDFMRFLKNDSELVEKVAKRTIINREFNRLYAEYEKEGDPTRTAMTYAMRCLRLATEYYDEHADEAAQEYKNYENKFNSVEFFSAGLDNHK